ncbi:hypothetical protein Dsin_009267 [Dipteronia sinensis]|uniref:Reverse transcriptase domain-containing protein n=1 Tax=Dipteronia sinensis TaxID=43782 RepID=A0AAE0AQN1_9ROSI|nr:hypothetical protein Dsin_009267 [Dipteronia sinensis]
MENIIGGYFYKIFSSTNPPHQPKLPLTMARFLDSKFIMEDVHKAVFDIGPMKAPGKDGLPALFYQRFWDTIGPSVVAACLSILHDGASMECINSTIITLIPKVQNPERILDFCPISLCIVLYKIVAKAISNRFRSVLDVVISANQRAFIPGRRISDNTIVGFECLHRLKRKKRKYGSMALKLDMSKAYDRVEWVFLEKMVLRLGFSVNWVSLLMRCVSSVSYSFNLNGQVCGNFKQSRGLRQGDPLSPYLFLICAEGLSSMINEAQARGTVTGFKCSRGGPAISHLFFADDSLIFSKANVANCVEVRRTLDMYSLASGQLVNFDKPVICVSPSMDVTEAHRLAALVGVKLVNCHERYLRAPLFFR